jgi:hypothetical protein
MPLLLIIGCALILGGISLFVAWAEYFWLLFKALFPLVIISFGGIMAYFGWEERKDRKGAVLEFSSPAEASRYQAEALAYQEKINNLQETQSLDVDPSQQLEAQESQVLPRPVVLDKPEKEMEAKENEDNNV